MSNHNESTAFKAIVSQLKTEDKIKLLKVMKQMLLEQENSKS